MILNTSGVLELKSILRQVDLFESTQFSESWRTEKESHYKLTKPIAQISWNSLLNFKLILQFNLLCSKRNGSFITYLLVNEVTQK